MAIKKFAMSTAIQPFSSAIAEDPAIAARFKKVADDLRTEQRKTGGKVVSELLEDFLFCSATMMHASEASLIDQETGKPVLNAKGEPARGWFEKIKDKKGRESVRWTSPDGIPMYKNSNLDIFPEEELLKAYRDWVGKPLCKDHISSSVDGIRGIIVDTAYDHKFKRVHALFALDKKNYPDLARKVEAGYAINVSMGTAVGRSVCSECQNVASTEPEFCSHVKSRACYGEINLDLSPIELSLVVTGADPRAKVKQIFASLKDYEKQVDALRAVKGADLEQISHIRDEIAVLNIQAQAVKTAAFGMDKFFNELDSILRATDDDNKDQVRDLVKDIFSKHKVKIEDIPDEYKSKLATQLKYIGEQDLQNDLLGNMIGKMRKEYLADDESVSAPAVGTPNSGMIQDNISSDKAGYADIANGDMGRIRNEGKPGDMYNDTTISQFASADSFYVNTYDINKANGPMSKLELKVASIKAQIDTLQSVIRNQELKMSFKELKDRAAARKLAFYNGTEGPTPGKAQYVNLGDQDKLRDKEDRQMIGEELDLLADNPDQKTKELLHRAQQEGRMARRAAAAQKIANERAALVGPDGKVKAVVDKQTGKVEESMSADDGENACDDDVNPVAEMTEKSAALQRLAAAKKRFVEKTKSKTKSKVDKDKKKEDKVNKKVDKEVEKVKKKNPSAGAVLLKTKMKDSDKKKSKAFYFGTEDPTPGRYPYAPMGDQDRLRNTEDRNMMPITLDLTVDNPDDAFKRTILRFAQIRAKLVRAASIEDNRWEVYGDDKVVLTVRAGDVYGSRLLVKSAGANSTPADFFNDREYGKKLIKMVRAAGPAGAAADLGLPTPPTSDGAPAAGDDAPPKLDDGPDQSKVLEEIAKSVDQLDVTLSELKSLVSPDAGVKDLDLDMNVDPSADAAMDAGLPALPPAPDAATAPKAAALKSELLEAYAYLTDMSNDLNYLGDKIKTESDHETIIHARSALRDSKVALWETNAIITRFADLQSDMYALDDDDLDEVHDEVANAIKDHAKNDSPPHTHMEKQLAKLQDAVDDLKHSNHDGHMGGYGFGLNHDTVVIDDDDRNDSDDDSDDAGDSDGDDARDGKVEEKTAATKTASRRSRSAALVAKAMKLDTTFSDFHKGQGKLDLELPSSEDLEIIENGNQQHDKIMRSTEREPSAQTRQAARNIAQAIKVGSIDEAKLDQLAQVGLLEPAAVDLYRAENTSPVDEKFAATIAKDWKRSTAAEDTEVLATRYKRAYHVGIEAQQKGMIDGGKMALDEYVDVLVNLPEQVFASTKRLVTMTKSAGGIRTAPMVGHTKTDSEGMERTASASGQSMDATNWKDLANVLWGDKLLK